MDVVRAKANGLEADGGQNGPANGADKARRDVRNQVRHDLPEQDAWLALAIRPRDGHVRALANRQDLRADSTGRMHPRQGGHSESHELDRHVADASGDDDHDCEAGDRQERIRQNPDDRVDGTAEEAGCQPQHKSDGQADDASDQADTQGLGCAEHHDGQHVAALRVGPEQVLRGRGLAWADRADRGQPRIDKAGPEQT